MSRPHDHSGSTRTWSARRGLRFLRVLCISLLLPSPEVSNRTMPMSQTWGVPDCSCNIVLGADNSLFHRETMCKKSRYSGRERTACTMRMDCLDTLCSQLNETLTVEVEIDRLRRGSALRLSVLRLPQMSSFDDDMPGTHVKNRGGSNLHISKCLDPLTS